MACGIKYSLAHTKSKWAAKGTRNRAHVRRGKHVGREIEQVGRRAA